MGKTERENRKAQNRLLWKRQLWKLPWVLLLPIGLLLPRLSSMYPDVVELYYSEKLYPHISGAMGALSSRLSGSLAEFIVLLLLFLAAGLLLLLCVRLLQHRVRTVRLVSFILSLCIAAGALLNAFYWLWGFNYAREPLASRMGVTVKERPVWQLETLCHSLAEKANTLRQTLPVDSSGVFTLQAPAQTYIDALPAAYAKLSQEEPVFAGTVYPAKQVYFSEVMSYGGIAGIYVPFTGEANVNRSQPPLLLLSSAAHENAHFLGIAKEDEANFAAYLACLCAEDACTVYSGVMLALIHCGNALHDADAEKYAAVQAGYCDGVRLDLNAHNRYWDSYEGKAEETVDKINDTYLKHNRQEAGVKSYGMMVDLLLAYYFD